MARPHAGVARFPQAIAAAVPLVTPFDWSRACLRRVNSPCSLHTFCIDQLSKLIVQGCPSNLGNANARAACQSATLGLLCGSMQRLSVQIQTAARRLAHLQSAACARHLSTISPDIDAEVSTLPTYEKVEVPTTVVVRKKGHDVITDALYNKGTAFPLTERERLGLRGLLPPRILSLDEQEGRVMQDYREGLDFVSPEEVESWSISRCELRRCLAGIS